MTKPPKPPCAILLEAELRALRRRRDRAAARAYAKLGAYLGLLHEAHLDRYS